MNMSLALLGARRQPFPWGTAIALGILILVYNFFDVPTALLGVAYVILFYNLASTRPGYALGLTFASVPFVYDLTPTGPFRLSLAEVSVAILFPIMIMRNSALRKPIHMGPIATPVAIHFIVCIIASVLGHQTYALTCLTQMFLYMVVAVLVFANYVDRVEDLITPLHCLIAVGVVLSVCLFGFGAGGYLFGLHKNGLGACLAAALVVSLECWFSARTRRQKKILMIAMGIIAPGLLYSLSRGAWIAAATGTLYILALRRQYRVFAQVVTALIPVILVCWFLLPSESRQRALEFDSNVESVRSRFATISGARAVWLEHPILGDGVGARKTMDATNIVWITLAESGILGLVTFIAIQIPVFQMAHRAQRYLSLTDPLFTLLSIGGALSAGRLAHGLVDHYWSRGAVLVAWAGVGITTMAYYTALARGARLGLNLEQDRPRPMRRGRPRLLETHPG